MKLTNRLVISILLLVLILWGLPRDVEAWGDQGHELVCEIAFQELKHMDSKARQEVQRLIELDPEFGTFAESCTWPDHPKTRGQEHYVNVPRYYTYIGSANCGRASKCIFSAIAEDRHVLTQSSTSDQEKLRRLKYLGHWIGDIHQPLHVSFKDDRGGGHIEETGDACAGNWNLHSVWDTCLVKERVLDGSVRKTAKKLRATLSDEARLEWAASNVVDWADESYKIAIRPEVGYCFETQAGSGKQCGYDTGNVYLDSGEPKRDFLVDEAYLDTHAPTAKNRILQAGIRLAALLDSIFDPEVIVD